MTADMPDFRGLIARVADGATLSVQEARTAFDIMMSGDATPSQMGAFLMALRLRGETVDEITGSVMAMREKMTALEGPPDVFDVVGTGGDGKRTVNVSTATSFVVSAAGVNVAKHGNRAASSQTGAADVLTSLGVNIDAHLSLVRKAAWDAGICFMMATRHHGAMRNVGPTRVELGTRTIFNILGPMSNPAGARRQLIGVFARQWLRPMAETLRTLGSERVWLVHGADGTDELTTTGPSFIVALEDGEISEFELTPEQAGLPRTDLDALRGGKPEENARALKSVLGGEEGPFRDIVLYNAAAALLIAGKADDLESGVGLARQAIDGGGADDKLRQLIEITNSQVPEAS